MTHQERERIAKAWKRAGIIRNELTDHHKKRVTQELIDTQDGLVDMLAQILTDANPKTSRGKSPPLNNLSPHAGYAKSQACPKFLMPVRINSLASGCSLPKSAPTSKSLPTS